MLFLVFFDDRPEDLENDIDSYAVGLDIEEVENKLSSDCERITIWMAMNRLRLNTDKTHMIILGSDERLRSLSTNVRVFMDNTELQKNSSEILLGCPN